MEKSGLPVSFFQERLFCKYFEEETGIEVRDSAEIKGWLFYKEHNSTGWEKIKAAYRAGFLYYDRQRSVFSGVFSGLHWLGLFILILLFSFFSLLILFTTLNIIGWPFNLSGAADIIWFLLLCLLFIFIILPQLAIFLWALRMFGSAES